MLKLFHGRPCHGELLKSQFSLQYTVCSTLLRPLWGIHEPHLHQTMQTFKPCLIAVIISQQPMQMYCSGPLGLPFRKGRGSSVKQHEQGTKLGDYEHHRLPLLVLMVPQTDSRETGNPLPGRPSDKNFWPIMNLTHPLTLRGMVANNKQLRLKICP